MIITVDVGTKEIFRSSATYSQVYKYLKKRVSLLNLIIISALILFVACYSILTKEFIINWSQWSLWNVQSISKF